jgi:prepilin-type N-terminal cleavage/methylation domain-containing protein
MNRTFFVLHRKSTGFSLLEVLIAIVVLSVGLLALAALQGSLTSSSADAKVRGRVAAMLTTHLDELRSGGYGTIPIGAAQTFNTVDPCDGDATDWLDCARIEAGLAQLSVTQSVAVWFGTASFAASNVAQDPSLPQFKRITLTSSWTDARGSTHQQSIATDVSSMALTNNIVIPPPPNALPTGGPLVRTINPATNGVIPIALSTEATSATSNPVPELVGQSHNQEIVGTRFNVLNYTPPGFGNSVVIQKRFENEIVKCKCKYGAGGVNLPEIYRTAQWPAIWTGDRYEVHVPDGNTLAQAPGQTRNSGPKNGVEQSALCQECCRDHHDTGNYGEVRFDPERLNGETAKYDLNGSNQLVAVNNTNNGDYVDSCRLIRVDGFWRTASDLYERQYGMLETRPVSSVLAKNGLPTTNATSLYTTFVKNFLAQYTGNSSGPPSNAQSTFNATTAFDVPTVIPISTPSNTDYRYLHGRGLYVDHLEQKARDKLSDVIADTDPQGRCPPSSPPEDCVMPYLPFTTANLTEIAKWVSDNPSVLTVNSANLLSTDPTQPSGGRTIGKSNGTGKNETTMRRSNSGVAVSSVLTTLAGVDPEDNGELSANDLLTDKQDFQVGGSASGASFDVRVTGGGANPFVFFTLGTDVNTECLKPAGGDHHCATAPGTVLPLPGAVKFSNYWIETTVSQQLTAVCNGRVATDTVAVPTFRNYVVTAATVNGVNGTIGASVNDNKITESTTVDFGIIAQGALVLATLTEQVGSPTSATITSCTTNGGGNKINNIVWNKPWTLP